MYGLHFLKDFDAKFAAQQYALAKHSLVQNVLGFTARADFVVGDFTHADGGRYVMIVNKDRVHSRPCDPKFRNSPGALKMVSPYTGQLTPFEGEQVWLAPGAGVLLKIGK